DGTAVEHKTASGSQTSVTFSRSFSTARIINWSSTAYDIAGAASGMLTGSFSVVAPVVAPSPRLRISAWISPGSDSTYFAPMESVSRHGGALQEANIVLFSLNAAGTLSSDLASLGTIRPFVAPSSIVPTIQSLYGGSNLVMKPSAREAHAQRLYDFVHDNGFAGIDIDYEDVTSSVDFNAFLKILADKLHAAGAILSVVVHGLPHGGEDLIAIGQIADEVKFMCYNFDNGTLVPLAGLDKVATRAEQIPLSKVVIALPWYGRRISPNGAVTEFTAKRAQAERSGVVTYADGDATYSDAAGTVYFEDATSYAADIAFLQQNHSGITKIGHWQIGEELDETWSVIDSMNTSGPNFAISGATALDVAQGTEGRQDYGLVPQGGFSDRGTVDVVLLSNRFEGSVRVTSSSVTSTNTITLSVMPTTATPLGKYFVGVRFSSGSLTHLKLVTVNVTAAPARARPVRH
ncbi:MAG: spore germination protein, partial [Thermoanaerobaculia bacterium]|nr:spore germination protein [Thermoanaerobaculia bacterium]